MQVAMNWGLAVSLLALAPAEAGGQAAGDAVQATASQPSASRSADAAPPPQAARQAQRSPAQASSAGMIILEDDFESETLGSAWSGSGNETATPTKSEHFRGQRSLMLKLGPQDTVPYRTEVVLSEKKGKPPANRDYCIRYAFKVKDWTDFPRWVTLFQTHAIPANGDFSCRAGRNSISLVSGTSRDLGLAVIDRPVARRRAGTIAEVVHSQNLTMDRWYTVQFHYRPSFDASGIIEAWIDGKKIYSQSGANMDPTDQCGRPSEPYVVPRLGLYKERGNTGTQTIYIDDFSLSEGGECK